MASLPQYGLLGGASAVAALAAVIDLKTRHIHDGLTLGALLLGVVARVALGAVRAGLHGVWVGGLIALGGVILCAVVPFLLCRYAGMGGGDLKLLAAVGALCGPVWGMQAEFYAFVSVLALRRRSSPTRASSSVHSAIVRRSC
jgi:prepilin peptidase CpaA